MYSFHKGGVNVCFGDGSVKFLTEDITLQTLMKLCARNDGKAISGNEY
jgi:prepilin-type processing-associated H-X9-DG protein